MGSLMGRNGKVSDQTTAMSIVNRALFTFAIVLIVLEVVGATFGIQIIYSGFVVQPRRTDLPLLLGLLILFVGNFNYYVRLIEPVGEPPGAALLSIGGMVTMAILPLVMLFEDFKPWRYLALTGYGLLVVSKNAQLLRRFDRGESRLIFRVWTRRAVVQTLVGVACGVGYYALIDRRSRQWVFQQLVVSSNISFTPRYDDIVNFVFNLGFLVGILTLYLLHHKDLNDLSKTSGQTKNDRVNAPVAPETDRTRKKNQHKRR